MKRQRGPERDRPLNKKLALVQAFDDDENQNVDVLRLPVLSYFYAFSERMEIEKTVDHDRLYHIDWHCLSALWFNQLADDLHDIPPVDTIAQVAQCRLIEVTTTHTMIQAVIDTINVPHFHEGWWVVLEVSDIQTSELDVPGVAFLPGHGSNDPATIGTTDNSEICFIRGIARVRPPSTLTKLLEFSHNWQI